jgi:hypothetical protein
MEAGYYIGSELELFALARNWKGYWGSIVRPYLGDRVLDVGAGIGETAKLLASDRHERWVCVEPDRRMAERIGRRISARELPRICEAHTGTIDDITERNFTSILYIDVLEHIEKDGDELGKAAERVQRDGRVIVLVPAHRSLYSRFDTAVGHFRRYTIAGLRALTPPELLCERAMYLDSIGLLASAANRLLLKSEMPTARQIAIWDGAMIPLSRLIDPVLLHKVGKSVLAIWRR